MSSRKESAVAETKFEVLRGFNYPPNDRRAEIGEIVELPKHIASALLARGVVRAEGKPKSKSKTKEQAEETDETSEGGDE